MTPDQVRTLVTAMQGANEPDWKIKQALDLAMAQEKTQQPAAQPNADLAAAKNAENDRKLRQVFGEGRQGGPIHQNALTGRWEPDSIDQSPMEFLASDPMVMGLATLGDKAANGITFGGVNRARRAIIGDQAADQLQETQRKALPGKLGEIAGNTAELGAGGLPLMRAAKGLTGVIEQAVPAATKSIGGRVATQAGTGALVGAGDQATRAAVEGDSWPNIGKRSFQGGLVGGVLGTLTSGAGEALNYVKGLIRNPNTDLGRTRGDYQSAINEGRIEKAEALPKGETGKQTAASDAGRSFLDYNDKRVSEIRGEHGEGLAKLQSLKGDDIIDQDVIQQVLDGLEAKNTLSNGTVSDAALKKALDETREAFTRRSGIVDAKGKEIVRSAGTLNDILKVKQVLADKAEGGELSTPENRPYRIISKALAQRAADLDPELGKLQLRYHRQMEPLEEANDTILGKDAAQVPDRASQKRTAAARFGGAGGLESPGGSVEMRRQLDEVGALDPAYRDMVRDVRAKQVLEDTRLSPFKLAKSAMSPFKELPKEIGRQAQGLAIRKLDPALENMSPLTDPNAEPLYPGWIPGIEAAVAEALKKKRSRKSQSPRKSQ